MAESAKKQTEIRSVKMEDGSIVDFAGKARIKKSSSVDHAGNLTLRIDFEDGTVRNYILNPKLVNDYALHGASQKFGDEVAGLKNEDGTPAPIEDFVQAMDELDKRVNGAGEWTATREGGAVAGGSILAKAMERVTGSSSEEVKGFLSTLTAKEKAALRKEPEVVQAIRAIEDERIAKTGTAAGESLLARFKQPA